MFLRRNALLVPLVLILGSVLAPVRAQAQDEMAGILAGTGYLALTFGSIVRLTEGPTQVRAGDDVRVRVASGTSGATIRGTLARTDSGTLVIRASTGDVVLTSSQARDLEVLQGTESKWAQGFTIGLVGGTVLGAVGGYASGDDPKNTMFSFGAGEKAVILGTAGGLAGSLLLAGGGLFIRGEHWRGAKVTERSFAVSPIVGQSNGVAFRLTF
jgi:hypothetical protein